MGYQQQSQSLIPQIQCVFLLFNLFKINCRSNAQGNTLSDIDNGQGLLDIRQRRENQLRLMLVTELMELFILLRVGFWKKYLVQDRQRSIFQSQLFSLRLQGRSLLSSPVRYQTQALLLVRMDFKSSLLSISSIEMLDFQFSPTTIMMQKASLAGWCSQNISLKQMFQISLETSFSISRRLTASLLINFMRFKRDSIGLIKESLFTSKLMVSRNFSSRSVYPGMKKCTGLGSKSLRQAFYASFSASFCILSYLIYSSFMARYIAHSTIWWGYQLMKCFTRQYLLNRFTAISSIFSVMKNSWLASLLFLLLTILIRFLRQNLSRTRSSNSSTVWFSSFFLDSNRWWQWMFLEWFTSSSSSLEKIQNWSKSIRLQNYKRGRVHYFKQT